MKLLASLQGEVPHPLGNQVPAFLSPGRMTTPSLGIDLLIFIGKQRFTGPAMQRQRNDIAGSEGVLWEVREEQFGDHPFSYDLDGTLLLLSAPVKIRV
jgi:hypothetical protein